MVISDPVVLRHILKENVFAYDKGVLSEILEPFMGQGLIPAPFEVWKDRRRAIVPGFHQVCGGGGVEGGRMWAAVADMLCIWAAVACRVHVHHPFDAAAPSCSACICLSVCLSACLPACLPVTCAWCIRP